MSDPKNEMKKGMPGNFVLFLIVAFFVVMLMQNFLDIKSANVSFSYQLESLVNLDLIQPEDSRKTAINDNLVSFNGQFREQLTDDSKKRYKFLDLLNTNHTYTLNKAVLEEDLAEGRAKILESAELYLHLSGRQLPETGFVVTQDAGTTLDSGKSITLTKLSNKKITSFQALKKRFQNLQQKSSQSEVALFGTKLTSLIANYRSPLLGIGSEEMKKTLREVQSKVQEVNNADSSIESRMDTYGVALAALSEINSELETFKGNARLTQLRSVRNYLENSGQYSQLLTSLANNEQQVDKAESSVRNVIWFFNNKELSTVALMREDPETYKQWFLNSEEEWNNFDKNRGAFFKAPDQPLNTVLEKKFRSEEPPPKYLSYLFPAMLAFSVLIILYVLFSRQMRGGGSGAMSFGKSPARLIQPDEEGKVTFKDVAGIEEAKEELQEIVDFLKCPLKFTSLGGQIPKGVLCIGPPGTGKTLIARAVAGEADRPFYSISGSDFVEMFVGVGASRIRDLFEQAKKNSPCIVFIDEIDAVGRHRGAGMGGGHDEREQTLNQLLVEMDGFSKNEGVIIMAATNRPDVLDKALLRPGRFDRHVTISLPDIKGRAEILKVHASRIKLDSTVDLTALARGTPGCSGADLSNMLNESALIAARKGRTAVTMQEIMEARDKVLYGKERRSLEIDENDKLTTAYHEAGHTVVGLVVEHGDPIDKVTIIPRGMSLGSTMFLPTKNKLSYWKKELVDQLAVLMGGRCAEEIFAGDVSSGAKQDIEHATHLARSMVCEWGMSDKLGAVAYDEHQDQTVYGAHNEKKYSEATAQQIDSEVRMIMDEANNTARKIIKQNHDKMELMAKLLMDYETLDSEDLNIIMEGRWDDAEKKLRLKKQEELYKKPTPPPAPPEEETDATQKKALPPQEESAPA